VITSDGLFAAGSGGCEGAGPILCRAGALGNLEGDSRERKSGCNQERGVSKLSGRVKRIKARDRGVPAQDEKMLNHSLRDWIEGLIPPVRDPTSFSGLGVEWIRREPGSSTESIQAAWMSRPSPGEGSRAGSQEGGVGRRSLKEKAHESTRWDQGSGAGVLAAVRIPSSGPKQELFGSGKKLLANGGVRGSSTSPYSGRQNRKGGGARIQQNPCGGIRAGGKPEARQPSR